MLKGPGLSPINKNLSSYKFSDKNLKILNPQKILVQMAGQIFVNFPQNILIGTQFENLWNLSEI